MTKTINFIKMAIMPVIALSLLFFTACSGKEEIKPADGTPVDVTEITFSSCNPLTATKDSFLVKLQDMNIYVNHLNATTPVCINEVAVEATIKDNTLILKEDYKPTDCNGLCKVDISYTVQNVMKDVYAIVILAGTDTIYNRNLLQNSEWKLVKFVDQENHIEKTPEPENDFSYILKFNSKNVLDFTSSTNELHTNFQINTGSYSFKIGDISGTEVNEYLDGDLFLECLKQVDSYALKGNNLLLYYNKDKSKYLIFNKL